MIEIILNVKPTPKGRPRFTRFGHAFTPKKTLDAEKEIKNLLNLWIKDHDFKIIEEKPVKIEMFFFFAPPKSISNKKKQELIGKPHIKKPDCDNLIKLVSDAMNGLIFKDDSQIFSIHGTKIYSEEDHIKITIE